MTTAPHEMKEVGFGDGLLRFRVPAAWADEIEADGTAAFYDPGLEAGTLRVKVLTFTAEEELSSGVALRELGALEPAAGQTLEALPNGNALRIHREENSDPGEPTVFHVWMVASIDPPHYMRLAVFSFAILARDADTPETRRLLVELDREVRRARFAHQVS